LQELINFIWYIDRLG
ncbi:hypothetical protein D039_1331B, partial [Vibrio parahaemolyticus EKP-028]